MLHLITCHGRIMPRLAELLFFFILFCQMFTGKVNDFFFFLSQFRVISKTEMAFKIAVKFHLLGFTDSFCFVFTSSPFYEASPLCTILCTLCSHD